MTVKRVLIALIITALSGIAVWLWQTETIRSAPDVTFKTISNKELTLSSLKGKPIIVTFWATDCPGCIKEIPHLIDLHQQYHPRGLEIIAIAMYYDPPSHVVAMSKAKQLPYDIALDLRAEHSKAFGDVMLTPTTFLISPQGNIVMQKVGLFDLNGMKQRIENLLKISSTTGLPSFAEKG